MYKVGDKVVLEIESITDELLDRCATGNTQPFTLYKLKGIPMYLAEPDFLNAISEPKEEEIPIICDHCGKEISEAPNLGDKCPHCGVVITGYRYHKRFDGATIYAT